ncbi:hypothetical protein FB451DRAFT_1057607 [Mycena latifolia]|nr:hypothetical protein FB451DRAFT_1057607 [Mycena latifolia]
MDYQRIQAVPCEDEDEPPTSPVAPGPSSTPFFAWAAVDNLSRTSASFLTTSSPLKSASAPPAFKPFTISPMKSISRYAGLLERPIQSAREQELVDALRESEAQDSVRKRSMVEMQAGVMLAGMYSNRAHTQLQAQETRRQRKSGKKRMGDGKAKYFTGDEFFNLAVNDARQREEDEVGKEQRKMQRAAHAAELALWKQKNEAIKQRNEAKRVTFASDSTAWELEKAAAKLEKRRPGWEKPKWKDYGAEQMLPRPKMAADDKGSQSENGEDVD